MYTKSLKMFSGPTFAQLGNKFFQGVAWGAGVMTGTTVVKKTVEKMEDSLDKKTISETESKPTFTPKP
ncbi:MAG: hypothetical protein WC748_02435 [Legionellales bacterium]|jgi:hypothetical protein